MQVPVHIELDLLCVRRRRDLIECCGPFPFVKITARAIRTPNIELEDDLSLCVPLMPLSSN
jgi:hypothetical protein